MDRLSPVRTVTIAQGLVMSGRRKPACDKYPALSTDAEDRHPALKHCGSAPKRGIATNSGPRPGLVGRPDPKGEEIRKIAARIPDTLNELEDQALVSRYHSDGTVGTNRLGTERRQNIPLSVKKAFRIQEAGSTHYYLEMIRGYPGEDVVIPYCSFFQGGLRDTGDELVLISQNVELPGADWKSQHHDTPFVFRRRATGVDVLVRRGHWESEETLIPTILQGIVNQSTSVWFGGAGGACW